MMRAYRWLIAGSLARRFALAAAALAASALLLTAASSWWMVSRQHAAALRELQQKEADSHAEIASATLYAISSRLSEIAESSILATGLVDSAGRETYLTPYLNGIRQINGIPIQILFTDFEGKEISSNGAAGFTPQQIAWLRTQLESGRGSATIFDGPQGPELVAAELLSYSRTRTPEGALLYKVALRALEPNPFARLAWGQPPATAAAQMTAPIDMPPKFRHLGFRIVETAGEDGADSLAPQYGTMFAIALALAAAVLVLGSRLALALTRDVRRLEAFSRSVVQEGFGARRAELSGSSEVVSLAQSINHMLDRLYEQHTRLQHESEKLRQLANTIPQLAWIAEPNGRILWYNDRWYAYTGTTPEQMDGRGWQRVHDRRTLPELLKRMREAIASGESFQLTCPLRGADGEFRPFLMSAAPLRDASGRIVQWFGTHTDVSPLEKAEQAARESEERLREGLVAARMVVWDWDIATGTLKTSDNARDVFGYMAGTIGEAWESILPEDLPSLRDAVERAIAERGKFENVVRRIRPDNGELMWIQARGTVNCDASGDPGSIRGISLDITERKRAEEALRAANRRKDEFLAMLAHELRNPLAPISTAAQLMKLADLDPARVRETSEIIARQVEHMTSLVDDLLDVSRVTRGLVTLDMEMLDIAGVVAGAVEQVRSLIDARRHRLAVRMPPRPVHLRGDRTRLVQIIANILNNAAKYTPEGGDILLHVTAEPDVVEIAVRDNGIGITPELLPHVFEPFTQADRSPDRSQGGLGLGLSLVKSLVELHGGEAGAHSGGSGKGSEFIIRLPRLADTASPPRREDRRHVSAPGATLTLMVVDDNVDAARSLAMLLEARGCRVLVEHDAASALERARAEAPQVLLLDIGLPGMDGYELARRLRAHPRTARSVFVAVTGYGRAEDRERSRAAGFDHHLVKPVNPAELAAILADIDPASHVRQALREP